MVRVQRSVERWRQEHFGSEFFEGVLDDALAGARLADEDAEATLLAMDAQRTEDFVLGGQQFDVVRVEWILFEAEIGSDHVCAPAVLVAGRSLAMKSTGRASPIRSALK